jgi:hypothetical protein
METKTDLYLSVFKRLVLFHAGNYKVIEIFLFVPGIIQYLGNKGQMSCAQGNKDWLLMGFKLKPMQPAILKLQV